MTNPTTDEMAREVAIHFGMLACNGKCDRLHLCQKKCAKLSTSLDAWAEHIWPCIWNPNGVPIDKQKVSLSEYAYQLSRVCGAVTMEMPFEEFKDTGHWMQMDSAFFMAIATAMHHLTAAYAVVKGE